MTQVMVRLATTDDVSGIMPIFSEVVDYHAAIDPEVYTDADMNAFEQSVREQLTKDNWKIFVAEADEKIVGFLTLQMRSNRRQYGNVADVDGRIDCLAVGEQYRQMGIGTKLITAMETYLKSQGIFEIRLTVSVHNPAAIKCYEKMGMKPYLYSMRKELK